MKTSAEKAQLSVTIPKYIRAELKALAARRDLKMGDMVAELILLESEKQKKQADSE
tara:strand:- start:342 stop:509 length:168 start_codon:yes stop_codon:yes gene_type:complete